MQSKEDLLRLLARDVHNGHITRRVFIERVRNIGLAAGAISAILSSCSSPVTSNANDIASSTPALISWRSEHDDKGIYPYLVKTFNETNKDGIRVGYINGPEDTGQQYMGLVNALKNPQRGQEIFDVFSIDIVWVDEFASNQWIIPLSDRWPVSERSRYLSIPMQAVTFQDKVWAAPFRTDVGLLYYRSDLVHTPPKTWEELTEVAQELQMTKQVEYGYIWQGAQYEGLLCNFVEMVSSYGGSILDIHDPKRVNVNRPEVLEALTKMVSWVNTISPLSITTFKEGDTYSIWGNGQAAFMRNWPYAVSLSNDANQSKVVGRFNIAPLPGGSGNNTGHSCIGGWQLGINAFSQKKDAAWKFTNWMLQEDAQQFTAYDATLTVTLKDVYQNQYILKRYPFFQQLFPILEKGVVRPRSAHYQDMSQAIQLRVFQSLQKKLTPASALAALEKDLQSLLSKSIT